MILSTRIKIYTTGLAILAVSLFGAYCWLEHRLSAGGLPAQIHKPAAVLPKGIKEQVTFNEQTHTLTVQTATKIVKEYANNPKVSFTDLGAVVIDRHLAGIEFSPFLGGGYAETGRIFAGANCFYFSRFDLSGSVGWTPDNHYAAIQPFIGVGYNFWHNSSFNIVVNPLSIGSDKGIEIGGFISVKL